MAIMGRPRKEIDQKVFEKLCGIQATKAEIAAWFDISEDTLETRVAEIYGETFSVVFAKKRGKGKIALRRSQMQMSEKSAAMAIFLGKNYLGQSDHQTVDVQAKVEKVFDTSKMTKEEYKEFISKKFDKEDDSE